MAEICPSRRKGRKAEEGEDAESTDGVALLAGAHPPGSNQRASKGQSGGAPGAWSLVRDTGKELNLKRRQNMVWDSPRESHAAPHI